MPGAWKLLLHIGPWKTGTKTVQGGLSRMSDLLSDHQIWYPRYGFITDRRNWTAHKDVVMWGHHSFANSQLALCHNATAQLQRDNAMAACWTESCAPDAEAAIRADLHTPTRHVILSSEVFGNFVQCQQRFLSRLRDDFRAFESVHVVFTYRNAAAWALSEYGQRLAAGNLEISEASGIGRAHMKDTVEKRCLTATTTSYHALVNSWSSAFGANLTVLDFDGMVANDIDMAAAVVHVGFPEVGPSLKAAGFPWQRTDAQEPSNKGAVHTEDFAPSRVLQLLALKMPPSECNLTRCHRPHVPFSRGRVSLFTALPMRVPTICNRLSSECKSSAKEQARNFHELLTREAGSRWLYYSKNVTSSAVELVSLPCELDMAALAADHSVWGPWMCGELVAAARANGDPQPGVC